MTDLRREHVPNGLQRDQLLKLARAGAETVVKQLRAEIIAIERTFPELALPRTRRSVRRAVKEAKKRTAKWSEEARQAVSKRMTKYWAERRKAKAKMR